MKKKIFLVSLIVIVLISGLFILTGCGKKPETTSIFIATKDGIKSSELDSLKYVSTKEKINQVKKNTMTDKKTGKTIIYEITDVEYEITALEEGKTTLTLEYIDYKTNETKKDIYNIVVDKDLKITVNKQ